MLRYEERARQLSPSLLRITPDANIRHCRHAAVAIDASRHFLTPSPTTRSVARRRHVRRHRLSPRLFSPIKFTLPRRLDAAASSARCIVLCYGALLKRGERCAMRSAAERVLARR